MSQGVPGVPSSAAASAAGSGVSPFRNRVSLGRRAGRVVHDTWLVTWRNLMFFVRNPYWIMLAVVQPVMFTLLFVFVFGGAIQTPNGDYDDYAIPGIIIQTMVFSSLGSGINIAEDLQKGVMDRFRSLPIGRGVVLTARTLSDLVRNASGAFIMAGVGFLVGYRFHGTWLDALAALGVALAFGYAFSWIAATIGLLSKNPQTAEVAGFTWAFPLVFASSIFVPVATMPKWLRGFARWNPVTLSADSVRAFSLHQPVGDAWWQALLWCAGIVVVFRALAVWRFRRLS